MALWCACAVAVNSWFDPPVVTEPTPLAAGISVDPIPEWAKDAAALQHLSLKDRKSIYKSQVALVRHYEADALGSPDPEWTGSRVRRIQETTDEIFVLAGVVLWLSCPSPLTFGPVLHFSERGNPASLRTAGILPPVLIRDDEQTNVPSPKDIHLAGLLLDSIVSLRRDRTLWIAIRMLGRALTESMMWEMRYLLLWVVLEALFGPESPQEITYRLSQRIALFLGQDAESSQHCFKEAKEGYAWRSKIVHGCRTSKLTPEDSCKITVSVEELVRRAFRKILIDEDLVNHFDDKDRDRYLDSLPFLPIWARFSGVNP